MTYASARYVIRFEVWRARKYSYGMAGKLGNEYAETIIRYYFGIMRGWIWAGNRMA